MFMVSPFMMWVELYQVAVLFGLLALGMMVTISEDEHRHANTVRPSTSRLSRLSNSGG